ncbi:hypothetical protein ACPXB3_18150 [Gordonia sp. DT219]|uniref:hypothetical protein n=1 Tax=Gordonia sp. DT219 TaxID=3416658 RepID=UPI003CEF8D09
MINDPEDHTEVAQAHHQVGRRAGSEPFTNNNSAVDWRTLGDFWSWAASDLLSNTLRGQLAEYIVGMCCVDERVRREWDAFDLKTGDGITVEVKSAAYLQSWRPTSPSSRRFGIAETIGWDADTNTYGTSAVRAADVYVFCVHTAVNRATADPLRLDQWQFYAVATATINRVLGQQKSIALSTLPSTLGVSPVGFDALGAAVRSAAAQR